MFSFRTFYHRVKSSSASNISPWLLDFGSLTVHVMQQQRVVFHQPACIVRHKETGQVVAIGDAAVKLLGKVPPSVECVWPVRGGKVVNLSAAESLLTTIAAQVNPETSDSLSFLRLLQHRPVTLAIGSAATSVDRSCWQKVLRPVAERVDFVPKAVATWQSWIAQHPQVNAAQVFFIDIGGMTTELALVSQGEVVQHKTLLLGGEDFSQAIIQVVREKYQCEVGWEVAERIKKELGRIKGEALPEKLMTIRGRHLLTSLPTTLNVAASAFEPVCTALMEQLFAEVRNFCQVCPAETLAAAMETGVYLTGGGSGMCGAAEFLQRRLQSPCTVSAAPLLDIITGLENAP